MTRDEELAAREAIRQLKARYFRGVDTKDAAVLRAVFAEGAETDFRSESPGRDPALRHNDPDAFVHNTIAMLEGVTTAHAGFMPEIEILSATEARGRWSMTDRLWVEDEARSRLPFRTLEGWGVYHDSYIRTEAGWRIAATRLERIKVIFG
jgi:SnoaL-like domain